MSTQNGNCLKAWGEEVKDFCDNPDSTPEPRQIQYIEGPTGGLTETYLCAVEDCKYQAGVTTVAMAFKATSAVFNGVEGIECKQGFQPEA